MSLPKNLQGRSIPSIFFSNDTFFFSNDTLKNFNFCEQDYVKFGLIRENLYFINNSSIITKKLLWLYSW